MYELPATPIGASANKVTAGGNYAAMLLLEKNYEMSKTSEDAAKSAIASATSIRKPIRLFVVKKDDEAEDELIKLLKINHYPAFIVLSDKGILGTFSGEMKKEELIEFLESKLR
jgi:hypothetical protein